MSPTIDAARLTLLLSELRLPAIKQGWASFAERADTEGWPAARFLAALAEHEIAERDRRRIERHLAEARLLPGKTLDGFEFDAVPMLSKARVMAICAGDSWIDKGANLLLIGGPGGGKTHLASAIGLALVENGWRVLFTRTSDLVQKLQLARRELGLEAAINRLDRFHLLILDDLAYVSKDQAETAVLFELISARYERRSLLITANQPFGAWGKVFPDPAMTLAAVDRLVHHATIFEINVDSYRRRTALERKQKGPGRPPTYATAHLRDRPPTRPPRTPGRGRGATIKPSPRPHQRQTHRTSEQPRARGAPARYAVTAGSARDCVTTREMDTHMTHSTTTAAERQAAWRNRRATAGENGERRINTWVSTGAALALARLARHHGLTRRAMLEHLIAVADDTVTAELDPMSHAWDAYFTVMQ